MIQDVQEPRLHRFDTIDLLRGLSILLVILFHTREMLSYSNIEIAPQIPHLRLPIFGNGGFGVQTFFTISGFLITYTSIKRFGSLRRMVPLTFYRIRFARIAPALLTVLLVLSVFDLAHVFTFTIDTRHATLGHALFAALTFHINWYEAQHGWLPPAWAILWSLSVEEMFYLFFPLACAFVLKRRWGLVPFLAILGALMCLGPMVRRPGYTANPIWQVHSYLGSMDAIAIGCLFALAAMFCERRHLIRSSVGVLLLQSIGACIMLLIAVREMTLFKPLQEALRFVGDSGILVTILAFAVGLVLFASVLRPRPGSPWTLPLRWLGRYSYEVYLTHQFVVIGVVALFILLHRGPALAWIIPVVLLSSLLGWLLSRLISEPANRALRGVPLPPQLTR